MEVWKWCLCGRVIFLWLTSILRLHDRDICYSDEERMDIKWGQRVSRTGDFEDSRPVMNSFLPIGLE